VWRVITEGLGHGSVWVNGHNLGRYPEKIPVNGVYIPECWLVKGKNSLMILDEDGRDAGRVRIEAEVAASRPVETIGLDDVLHWVDPLIGTAKSDVFTRWGDEGGTYPGAVAPSGYMQLSPETRRVPVRGYDFRDSLIYVFSCMHHPSGFPGGSAGRFFVMPLHGDSGGGRPFSHAEEVAEPGYYKVRLRDDGTVVEAVATVRTGVFRITFPGGVEPKIFVGDTAGSAFVFSEPYVSRRGEVYSFTKSAVRRSILIRVSSASAGAESARRNIDKECVGSFETLRSAVAQEWRKALSAVEVEDDNRANKTIFYTALYHSLLVPWVISDVDGNYRGDDHRIHRVMGRSEYGQFSPWDSYRSLHPLLTLLYPEKQSAMLQSLLDIYQQAGYLPIESMTGNHVVSIIVDAYRKGIRGIDTGTAYDAMLKSLIRGPFQQEDRAVYAERGYIPLTHPESVTRTVEYGYDDWVLGQYAGKVMGDKEMEKRLEYRSVAYRHLLYTPSLLLLPKEGDSFRVRPGNSGYKEGDPWVYSYFAPQDAEGLIDRMGGEVDFSLRLDSALSDGRLVFDNETMLHVPYFFNAAGRWDLTRKWVEKIMKERYSDRPGGLPGNDDLGAMSSWYVFSALGFFPFCPGSPSYSPGVPLFRKAVLHLAGGRQLVIRRGEGDGGWLLNGRAFDSTELSHGTVMAGGELVYREGGILRVQKRERPVFELSGVRIAKAHVGPGEVNTIYFSLWNKGLVGVKRLVLLAGGKAVGSVNCLLGAGQKVSDSLSFRLYERGTVMTVFGGIGAGSVEVVAPLGAMPELPEVSAIDMRVMVREGDSLHLRYTLKNVGWERKQFRLPVRVDGEVRKVDTVLLLAGEEGVRSAVLSGGSVGWHDLKIGEKVQRFRVYRSAEDAVVLDIDTTFRSGKDKYIRIAGNSNLGDLGERLTMLLWVKPEEKRNGLVDIFSNGDNHVLQIVDGRQLTFFAGGWGRGDNTVDLPADWIGHWHLIAGTCGADGLRVYIDGELKGFTPLEKSVHLFGGDNSWIIGRNDEFPGQRIFVGSARRPRIYQEVLSGEDILSIYRTERNNP
jgi:putative alpha-1,2-mannosidase